MTIRFATVSDAPALLAIYAQYIDTTITFEYDLPSVEEFAGRIRDISSYYPYLVCETDGNIVGYAYAHRARERTAYDWFLELSIYLDRGCTGQGLGTALYSALMDLLRAQNIKTVMGCVTLPNEKSEALHRTMGFRLVGTSANVGYKNGAWHDVAWFEKAIGAYEPTPSPVVSINDVAPETVATVLNKYS